MNTLQFVGSKTVGRRLDGETTSVPTPPPLFLNRFIRLFVVFNKAILNRAGSREIALSAVLAGARGRVALKTKVASSWELRDFQEKKLKN